jgi:hypothetical protein
MESNIVKARSSIVFILALLTAFAAVLWIEKQPLKGVSTAKVPVLQHAVVPDVPEKVNLSLPAPLGKSADIIALPIPRALTVQEVQWARTAWQYFKNNTDIKTGLVNSVESYPAATMWDSASYLLALLSARKLDVITQKEFDLRVGKLLSSLGRLPLVENALPNKSYNTATLAMVDYQNNPTKAGIGWSAIDLGRLLVPLNAIVWNYPQHTQAVRKVVARWDISRLTKNGQLFGSQLQDGKLQLLQEGRLGYEQYAAKTFALIGLDVNQASDYRGHLKQTEIYGIEVPYDQRDAKNLGGHNYVLSEPYVLDGLELGWDDVSREFAWRIYRAQEERFRKTGVLTAVSEDHVDREPYFVYNTVFADGKAWNTLTEKGEDASALRSLSVKAAFGWYALYRSEYAGQLINAAASLYNPAKGWYAGLYEEGGAPNKSININTNAVVLESLAYIAHGKLLSYR